MDTNVQVSLAGLLDLAAEAWNEQKIAETEAATARQAEEARVTAKRKIEAAHQIAEGLARIGVAIEIDPDHLIDAGGDWQWPVTSTLAIGWTGSLLTGNAVYGPGKTRFLEYIFRLADLGRLVERTVEDVTDHGPSLEEKTWRADWLARQPSLPGFTRIPAARRRGVLVVPEASCLQLYVWGLDGDVALRAVLDLDEVVGLRAALILDGKCSLGRDAFAVCEGMGMHVFFSEREYSGHAIKLTFENDAHDQLRNALQVWLDYYKAFEAWSQERYDSGAAQPAQSDLDELPF